MNIGTKQKDRRIAFWIGFFAIIAVIVASFVVALTGMADELSKLTGLISSGMIAITSLGVANYFSNPTPDAYNEK